MIWRKRDELFRRCDTADGTLHQRSSPYESLKLPYFHIGYHMFEHPTEICTIIFATLRAHWR